MCVCQKRFDGWPGVISSIMPGIMSSIMPGITPGGKRYC